MTFSNFFRNSAVETHGRASHPAKTHRHASLQNSASVGTRHALPKLKNNKQDDD